MMVKDLIEDLETGNKTEEHIKNRLTPQPKQQISPLGSIAGNWGQGLGFGTATAIQIEMQQQQLRRIYEQRMMGGF